MSKPLIFFAALLLLFGGVATAVTAYRFSNRDSIVAKNIGQEPDYLSKPDIPADELLDGFKLTERSGKKFDSDELDGQVHVASFFFASCPSTCRAQNEAIRTLHQKFGSQGVRFLSITVDPDKDTPERLSEYASLFGAHPDQWLFLTGDLLYTRRIGAEIYQMHVDQGVHMNRLAVVDKWGKVRGRFEWQDEVEVKKMNDMIAVLLEEQEPPAPEPPARREPPADDEEEDEGDEENEAVETEQKAKAEDNVEGGSKAEKEDAKEKTDASGEQAQAAQPDATEENAPNPDAPNPNAPNPDVPNPDVPMSTEATLAK